MTSKIQLLDEQTINKIAAGEVIENPSSVVKELVENAIDAAAKNVVIEIKTGGRYLIKVSDDGIGMNEEDALLCLERHATSKIRDVDNINSLMTMGFRGEAIPSIASISKFTLLTTPQGNDKGYMVVVEGGKLIHTSEAVRDPGTTIEVKSLFFNVPVRKKFQRSVATDTSAILKVVVMQALSHPTISFKLISDSKTLLMTKAYHGNDHQKALKTKIEDTLGKDFASSLRPISYMKEGVEISGFISDPSTTRPNRTGQYLFVNKRPVQVASIASWVVEGYGTRLATNRYPLFVIHMTIPSDAVDVNVHPQKREIRLKSGLYLKDTVIEAVDKALQSFPIRETLPWEQPSAICVEAPPPKVSPAFPKNNLWNRPPPKRSSPMPLQRVIPESPPKEHIIFDDYHTTPTVLGTIKHYIIARDEDNDGSIVLIDQHAAHARIVFEKMLSAIKGPVESQRLLIPFTIDLTDSEAELLREHADIINSLGIGLKSSNGNSFIVDALPRIIENSDIKTLIFQILEELPDHNAPSAIEREIENKIALAASRSALTTKACLSNEQAQALLKQLFLCQSSEYAPNGAPTMKALTVEELEVIFNSCNIKDALKNSKTI